MNPYLIPRPALISFSGGRTSGFMLKHIVDAYDGKLPDDIYVAFTNTGLEHEATLQFVADCQSNWNVPVHWLEFDPDAPDHTREVNFLTASRDGTPLQHVIRTRPTQHLFNPVSRYCTATAKRRRMQKFMHAWKGYTAWFVAVGLRADEMSRVNSMEKRAGMDRQWPVMPLATAGVTKEDVAAWWRAQSFDLKLPNVGGVTPLGNCLVCPLKSRAKIINVLRVLPDAANWPIRQEDEITERIKDVHYVPKPRPVYDKRTGQLVRYDPPLPDRRNRFFKDGTSYRNLLDEAQKLNASCAPMDEGYEPTIDCFCAD
jgi:3'-phosphoadenosine 5'-phosphosulfate sulfotransferase (PAPS reductase)/FAD synthetase